MKHVKVLLLFPLLILSGCANIASSQEDSLTLVVASDLHYLSSTLTDGGACFTRSIEAADGKVTMYAEELTDAFVQQVVATKPNAVILTGDLTFNGAKESHEHLVEKLNVIEENGIAVYVLPGNHDLNNPIAAKFSGDHYAFVESITALEFTQLYQRFGFDEAIAKDTASLSYVVDLNDEVRLLMVDVNGGINPGNLSEETLSWIAQALQSAKEDGKRVISCSHQNVLAHTQLFTTGFTMGASEELCKLYEQYGVCVNFSGHMHVQHIAKEKDMTDIASSSLALTPNQYGRVTLRKNTLDYQTIPVEVATVPDFATFSEDFFLETSQRKLRNSVEEEAVAFFSEVNLDYFIGHPEQIDWSKAPDYDSSTFWGMYLDSIRNEDASDQNHVTIRLDNK